MRGSIVTTELGKIETIDMSGANSGILYLGEKCRFYLAAHSRFRAPDFCLDRVWSGDVDPSDVFSYAEERNCTSLGILVERSNTVVCSVAEIPEESRLQDLNDDLASSLDDWEKREGQFSRWLVLDSREEKALLCSVSRSQVKAWIEEAELRDFELRYIDFLDRVLFRLFLDVFPKNVCALLRFSDLLYFGVFSPPESCKVARCVLPESNSSEGEQPNEMELQGSREVLQEWAQAVPFGGAHTSLVLSDALCSEELLGSLEQTWNGSLHSFSQIFRDAASSSDTRALLGGLLSTFPEYELWVHFRPTFFLRAGMAVAMILFLFSLCLPTSEYAVFDNVPGSPKDSALISKKLRNHPEPLEALFQDIEELKEKSASRQKLMGH